MPCAYMYLFGNEGREELAERCEESFFNMQDALCERFERFGRVQTYADKYINALGNSRCGRCSRTTHCGHSVWFRVTQCGSRRFKMIRGNVV